MHITLIVCIYERYATTVMILIAFLQALKRAAEKAKGPNSSGKVGVSIIEAFSKTVEPQELESVLRIEYRSKMLNPKVKMIKLVLY